jgi:ribosomal protein L30/L7E
MVLRGKGCAMNVTHQESSLCNSCKVLTENKKLRGILQRIKTGVHENTPLTYHSVGGLVALARRKTGLLKVLRLRRLNDTRKLAGKAVALDDMKQWVMAIGSGKVEHVDRLVRINLAKRGSIRSLLDLYDWAAKRIYHPRNYTEEDHLWGLLLWQLGGARVAGIAHQALNLPSLSTLRRHALIPRLLVSASIPTKLEIETNVANNFESMYELLESHRVVHQIFMLDELKTEERPRFDDDTNKIVGICREHGKKTSLEFSSEKEVDLLLECVDKGEVHLAVEVSHKSSCLM